ncbi:MAG: hypothetical protein ACP5P9_04510 [Acidimicrobiales bacterium]
MTDQLDAPLHEAVRFDDVVLLPPGDDVTRSVGGVSLVIDDQGVTLTTADAGNPRMLPWSSLETYVIEPISPSTSPWWVDPELHDPAEPAPSRRSTATPGHRRRRKSLVPAEPGELGALVSLRTAAGTYRLLVAGLDSDALAVRVRPLAAAHLPPAALPTVTTVQTRPATPAPSMTWERIRPLLAVLAAVVAAAAIAAILLQSAGVVHLPFLGGTGPTALAPAVAPRQFAPAASALRW